jgi:hypothetical protein
MRGEKITEAIDAVTEIGSFPEIYCRHAICYVTTQDPRRSLDAARQE